MTFKLIKICVFLYIPILITSCIKQPSFPDDNSSNIDTLEGAYILCEGLWHYDNSTISRYNFKENSIINDFFSVANPSLKLGDLANHIYLYKDRAFITVSTAQTIECISIKNGKSIGRIKLQGNRQPREIFISNDSIGFVTDLYTHSVVCFNPTTLEIIQENIHCGPAPEGINGDNNLVFVANSGYGDYLANEPKAGTISIIDVNKKEEIQNIDCGPNTCEIVVNKKRNTFYGVFYHLPSKLEFDSLGGIVEYDLNTLREIRRWRVNARSLCITESGDSLVYVNSDGVYILNLSKKETPRLLVDNNNKIENWYAIALCNKDNSLWVCNAMNFQINGKIMIFDLTQKNHLLNSFTVGVNPAQVVFF